MKIAILNNLYQFGGAETVARQVYEGVRQAGHEAHYYVAFGPVIPKGIYSFYPKILTRLSHTRFNVWVERVFPRLSWCEPRFRKLAASDYDVIHLHSFHANYVSLEALAFLAKHKPLVWTFHSYWGITGGCDPPLDCRRFMEQCGQCPQVGKWPIGAVDRTGEELRRKIQVLGPAPIHVVSPSQHLAKTVRESRVGRRWAMHVIPNGVSAARFTGARKRDADFRSRLGLQPDALVILAVTRNFLDVDKGFGMIREALVDSASAATQVVLAGQNSDVAARELAGYHACHSAGYVENAVRLAEYYEAADIFLFASSSENFPCVILEAMAGACCVVATPTGGVVEQIEHGKSGLLAASISGKALGETLRLALGRPERIRQIGAAARMRVQDCFSEERMIRAHLELYQKLVPTDVKKCVTD
ncbi:MAG: glycosyltransferase [Verrucomicrobiota bacterium]